VIVAHGSGMITTYSHMSAIAAAPGTAVHQGQVLGHVGASGLSTGPQLHFEVRVGSRPVNPLTARLVMRSPLEGAALAAFKARVKQLRSIPTRRLLSESSRHASFKRAF
jgi:murein DD-endopeptidase MepM/ murein hydrolase activator NlpD